MSNEAPKKKNTYSDAFKKEVAEAAQLPGATLASVGEQFGVSPTLVRNWKIKFLEQTETSVRLEEPISYDDDDSGNSLGSNNGNLKINAGWERKDEKYICRWIIVWEEMKNGSLAGALGGYSGGGVFQMEQFYAEHSSGSLTSLMIDIEDKITKDEIDFWNDRPKEAGILCDSAQDEIMAWHDEDAWEDWEQLILLDIKRTNLVEDGDLLLLSSDTSPLVKEMLELAGITAAPK